MRRAAGRGAVLHARARRLPLAAVALVGVALAAWAAEVWASGLADRGAFELVTVAVFAPLAAAVVLSVTLSGADVDLEHTSPRLSAGGRARRAVGTVLVAGLVLGAVAVLEPAGAPSAVLVRNVAGLLGAVLLAVTVLPPATAWVPALLYAGFTYLITPAPPPVASAWWSFLVQPQRPDASWLVAAALLVCGAAAYAVRGPTRGPG